ncbi:biotin--protein ligase [Lysobacter concretionis Ko07 = DSM 16239]|jgi:BirA family biotin operon repressor/biotin-[acetyl-CoA-carboxylase] ligase|uniref:Bifunctional ligase/repressor BirA n=1 Tax=Lysobacter concretionis Ko07 = DSM 16239 TaxID=1122185 RepID=A0A0A0ER33_9GAMM|nr:MULTISPECIES: bifunctional biotin--[acetyl-CoA-carboxylase] ligase/biotin operon repressor BirA [Lysobacter]KGM52894.1 biotin--protein ligase [Lysobacter concretionis Ko07 = DSM 16239]QOD92324.1 bifunctional biotin--[acetyl-CoA-carboxylase] synthetase/biotin operon repressor [Lysobacter sp. CW239]
MDDRALLARLIGGPVSGDALAQESGQTRAAVWKRIQALREAGVPIEAQPGRGYQLTQPFDLLDNDTLIAALPATVRARIASLEIGWVVDSTNTTLLRRASPADGMADVLLAERQTGGRGRRGRGWSSPLAAHLYLSLSRSFSGGLSRLGGLSLVAGLATVEALHGLGFGMVRLKWPNDLVVAGPDGALRKLGGLLIEGGGEHAGPVRAVIGLGLNVRMPDGVAGADFASVIDQPWCDLSQLPPATPSRNTLAAAILAHWVPALEGFDRTGLAPLLARYAALDAIAGQAVTVQGENSAITGTALGLAGDGALRVRLDDGSERCFHSGEVSVRRVAGRGR